MLLSLKKRLRSLWNQFWSNRKWKWVLCLLHFLSSSFFKVSTVHTQSFSFSHAKRSFFHKMFTDSLCMYTIRKDFDWALETIRSATKNINCPPDENWIPALLFFRCLILMKTFLKSWCWWNFDLSLWAHLRRTNQNKRQATSTQRTTNVSARSDGSAPQTSLSTDCKKIIQQWQ